MISTRAASLPAKAVKASWALLCKAAISNNMAANELQLPKHTHKLDKAICTPRVGKQCLCLLLEVATVCNCKASCCRARHRRVTRRQIRYGSGCCCCRSDSAAAAAAALTLLMSLQITDNNCCNACCMGHTVLHWGDCRMAHTCNAYSCPYSLLSWLRMVFVVMLGSFIASMLASPRHLSH